MPCKINLSLSELSDMIKTKNLTKLSEIEVNTIEDMMELDNFIDDAFEFARSLFNYERIFRYHQTSSVISVSAISKNVINHY